MRSTPEREREGGCPRLKLNFRRTRLAAVLDHLHKCAGLPIGIKGDVQLERPIDLWHDQPVTTTEALLLLKAGLRHMGCTVIQKGPMFSITTIREAKKTCIALPVL